jgi:hypothetical protein
MLFSSGHEMHRPAEKEKGRDMSAVKVIILSRMFFPTLSRKPCCICHSTLHPRHAAFRPWPLGSLLPMVPYPDPALPVGGPWDRETGGRKLAHLVVMCDLAAARPARTDLCPSIPLASDLPACAVGFLMPALDIQRPTLPGTAYLGPGHEDRDPTGRRCWKLRMDPPALHGPSTASPDAPVPPRIPAVATSVPAGETVAKHKRGGAGVDKMERRKTGKGAKARLRRNRKR